MLIQNKHTILASCFFAVCLSVAVEAVAGKNIINNPGFEFGFTENGVAEGWRNDSGWADVHVRFSKVSRYLPRAIHLLKLHKMYDEPPSLSNNDLDSSTGSEARRTNPTV